MTPMVSGELIGGGGALLLWLATMPWLYRTVRAPDRAAWLRDVMNVEYLLLTHMGIFVIGACLIADWLVPG